MAEAKPKRVKRTDAAAVQVVRDSSFHRAVVDNAPIFGVGDDIEIACLQAGREIRSVQSQGEDATLVTVETLTEVVRLRLSWPTATVLAMNVLTNGIRTGRLNGSSILDDLAALNVEGTDDGN
ncbi:MAG: hypothetical protein AABY88_04765 [Pseudomonadota bacterium]